MQKLEEQPLTAPYLAVPAVIRAAAEAAVPELEAKSQELEEEAQELGIPADPVGLDAYLIDMYRKCLGGPYKVGTIRSQRDLFGVFLGRPAGMPEPMAGQTRSVSVSRRLAKNSLFGGTADVGDPGS